MIPRTRRRTINLEELIKIDEYPIKDVLDILLKDWTTGKNIIWATDSYLDQGEEYSDRFEIQKFSISGKKSVLIQPRTFKALETQQARTKAKAEVFTPSWIVNKMNNALDENWFGQDGVFNTETENGWVTNHDRLPFRWKKDIESYIEHRVLEITCGEAPFIVSRYDTASGELIPATERIGILDRKLRAVNENYKDEDWLKYTRKAFKSVYGYEYQGDNLLIARINLILTFADHYRSKFNQNPNVKLLKEFAKIVGKNFWQMDGLTKAVPLGMPQPLHQQLSLFSVEEDEKDAPLCQIVQWGKSEISFPFELLSKENPLILYKGKKFKMRKFDVVIGNPPYQIENKTNTRNPSVYHLFVEEAKKMNPDYFEFVIPARWYAGGIGLDSFRANMINDDRIEELIDFPNSYDVFPNVDLAGGACIMLWNREHHGPTKIVNFSQKEQSVRTRRMNEYPIFVRSNIGIDIVNKVLDIEGRNNTLDHKVSTRVPYGIQTNYKPKTDGIPCWFKQRIGIQYADPKDIIDKNDDLNTWRFLVPKAPIAGQTDFTKPIGFFYEGNTIIAKPGEACTDSFLVLGSFDTEEEVKSFKSYILTKTVRFLLLQAVTSQNLTKAKFCFIPDLGNYEGQYSDEQLIKRWKITEEEWKYINYHIHNYEKASRKGVKD